MSTISSHNQKGRHPSNPPRPPRIHRSSLYLSSRIDGRPQRQPFLDHVTNDDFLAAYLGYDHVGHLNTLRFSGFILNVFLLYARSSWERKPFDMHLAIVYALQINACAQFTNKVKAFHSAATTELAARSDEAGKAAGGLLDVTERLSNFDFDLIWYSASFRHRSKFEDYLVNQRGVKWLRGLPKPTTYKIPPPVFMEDHKDLEGCLRFVALMQSITAVARPSVWRAKFPGTVQALPEWRVMEEEERREANAAKTAGGQETSTPALGNFRCSR